MTGRAGVVFLALLSLAPPLARASAFDLLDPAGRSAAPVHLRHPVVMVHGIFYRAPVGRGPHAYFRGVAERFRELGVPASFPVLGFSNGVAERAERLAEHIRTTWSTGQVNVIAHSIGGLATRDAIARLGLAGRVASLTMVSTPNRGTPVADWVVHTLDGGLIERLCEAAGLHADALRDLTAPASAAFNARTPDAPGVAYFSLGGAQVWYRIKAPLQPFSLLIRLQARVRAGQPVDEQSRADLAREPWGPAALAELDRVAAQVAAAGASANDRRDWATARGANDGVVPLTSTPWGTSWGAIDMDHLDEIGWGSNGQESADLYEWIVRSLAARGF